MLIRTSWGVDGYKSSHGWLVLGALSWDLEGIPKRASQILTLVQWDKWESCLQR